MPIYEYECQACGKAHEAFQGIHEQALITCPHCREDKLSKIVSSTSFQLKGTGWYATDIRDKNKPKPGDSTQASGADSGSASASTQTKTGD